MSNRLMDCTSKYDEEIGKNYSWDYYDTIFNLSDTLCQV
jgi:hypothetical protein